MYMYNKSNNNRSHSFLKRTRSIRFQSTKNNKLLSITLPLCNHLHQLTATMKVEKTCNRRRLQAQCWQRRSAKSWIVEPRKEQQIHQQTEIQILMLALLFLSLGTACRDTLVCGMSCKQTAGAIASMVVGASRIVFQGCSTTIWCAILSNHDIANAQLGEIEHVAGFVGLLKQDTGNLQHKKG